MLDFLFDLFVNSLSWKAQWTLLGLFFLFVVVMGLYISGNL